MIAAYVGAPGDCKTYSMVAWLQECMRQGRLGVAQFAVNGAWPLEYLHDLLHDNRRGAAVAIDEVGRILPARDWSNEDDVESVVMETHRHHGLDIRYAVQDVMQASVSLRRLTEYFIFCYRVGPDPSGLLKSGIEPHWWQCPFAVRHVWVHKDDMGSDGKPKTADKAQDRKVKYIAWRRRTAKLYDTTERLYPVKLQLEIEARLAEASERMSLSQQWSVVDGHAAGTISRLYRARDAKEERKVARAATGGRVIQLSAADVAAIQGTSEGGTEEGRI